MYCRQVMFRNLNEEKQEISWVHINVYLSDLGMLNQTLIDVRRSAT